MSTPASTRTDALQWLERYVEGIDEPAISGLALRIAQATAKGTPELGSMHDVEVEFLPLARESVRSFFAALPRDPWPEPDVPVAGLEFTRMLARRGADLPLLLKIYRLGQSAFWRASMQVAERAIDDPELRMRVLTLVWERLGMWIEVVVGRQIEVYEEERDRWVRGALARRVETIRAILAGEQLDPERASQILGHELRRYQTAFVLWPDDPAPNPDVLERLEMLAAELAAALGARRSLTAPSGVRGLWAWVGTDEPPDVAGLAGLPALQGLEWVRVAVGRPAHGLAGFVRSHTQALEARRIAVSGSRHDVLTSFADVELVCMLSHDEAAMRELVERELMGLCGDDPSSHRLRDTALAFLAGGSNARVAAGMLGTHKNTVLYRLRRIEELLGHPIEERRLALELALMLVDAFGSEVLPGAAATSLTVGPHAQTRAPLRAPGTGRRTPAPRP